MKKEQIMDCGKQFLIIGNKNAITYKEIFPLIKENKMWLGYTSPSDFIQPDGDQVKIMAGLTRWFTNLPHNKRKEELFLGGHYTENSPRYPKYDNYDAIEVSKVAEIPDNYFGVMGVPITFLDKYNPNQFEIVDINPHFFIIMEQGLPKPKQLTLHNVGKKDPYARILIRKLA